MDTIDDTSIQLLAQSDLFSSNCLTCDVACQVQVQPKGQSYVTGQSSDCSHSRPCFVAQLADMDHCVVSIARRWLDWLAGLELHLCIEPAIWSDLSDDWCAELLRIWLSKFIAAQGCLHRSANNDLTLASIVCFSVISRRITWSTSTSCALRRRAR